VWVHVNKIVNYLRTTRLWYFIFALIFAQVLLDLINLPNASGILLTFFTIACIAYFKGPTGLVLLSLFLVPFALPQFNVARIPILGQLFLQLSLKERAITILGLLSFPFYFTKLKRFRLIRRDLFLIIVINIFGILVPLEFAESNMLSIYLFYYVSILAPSMLFILVYRYSSSLKLVTSMLFSLHLGNLVFVIVSTFFSGSLVQYSSTLSANRYGGYFTFPFGITTYAGPVLLSAHLSFILLLSVGFFFIYKNILLRAFLLFGFVVTFGRLFFTFSRTGIYGIFAIPIFIYLYSTKVQSISKLKRFQRRIILLIIIIPLMIFTLYLGYQGLSSSIQNTDKASSLARVASPTSDGSNIYGRWFIFASSIRFSLAHPLGEGTQYLADKIGINHHSSFTKYLASLGWLGMFAYVIFVVRCTKSAWLGVNSTSEEIRKVSLLLWISIIQISAMSFGIAFFGYSWGVSQFWIVLALSTVLKPIRLEMERKSKMRLKNSIQSE